LKKENRTDKVAGEKLKRAEAQLEKAENTEDNEEALARIALASNILNSAMIFISSELADFNVETLRFQTEAKKKGIWEQHEAQVKRNHDKFMAVADGVVELIKRIPTFIP
jgi:hypothetical protein